MTEDVIHSVECDNLQIKFDDLEEKSNAYIVIPADAEIVDASEYNVEYKRGMSAGGFEIAIETRHALLTIIFPWPAAYFDNAVQSHLRESYDTNA